MKAVRLRCEYLTNPIGIDIRKPRLSWNCVGGVRQSAYRIVAKKDEETVWDSGKVNSEQMHLLPWGGSPLESRDSISWTVQLWDENNAAGEVSEPATFELGLLKSIDWKAKWIAGNYSGRNQLICSGYRIVNLRYYL